MVIDYKTYCELSQFLVRDMIYYCLKRQFLVAIATIRNLILYLIWQSTNAK